MTTTPTAHPQLPDLAEAVRKLVKAKGRFHTEQNYKALADALAQYDARRAQPEGEAPQAELRSQMAYIAAYDPDELDGGHTQDGMRAAALLEQIAAAPSAPGTPEAPTEPEYELHQDDMMVAGTFGKRAYEEILRYAEQYAQGGPVELHKVVRTKITIPRAAQLDGGQGEGERDA